MDVISIKQYRQILAKGRLIILGFSALFFLLAMLYALFIFKPTYSSQAKILIEEIAPTTFVSDIGQNKKLQTNNYEKNPILTQMEILSSYDMAQRVYGVLKSEQNNPFSTASNSESEKQIQRLQKSISLKSPPATDIIKISVQWDDALLSKRIAEAFLTQYRQYNVQQNNQSVIQTKKYIQNQLADSEKKLAATREEIRNFKKANTTIDLNVETSNIVRQVSDLDNTINALQSQMNYHQGKVKEYARKLQIPSRNIQNTISAVALGQNQTLSSLQERLNSAEQEYASMKVRYPETTKKMVVYRQNIQELKKQIKQQIINTVGNSVSNGGGKTIIKDDIRAKMLGELISSQSELMSINAQKQSLQGSLQTLKKHQKTIPDQQLTLAELEATENNLAAVVSTLHAKLVEASVRESEIVSNITVVQNPTLPDAPAFPNRWQIIAVMTLAGALLGCLYLIGQHVIRNAISSSSELEELLGVPVLGVFDWIPEALYQSTSFSLLSHPQYISTLQKIATFLRIQQEENKLSMIGFTSLARQGKRSYVMVSLAKLLSNCGYSVLIVDADFRHNTVHEEFGISPESIKDFAPLLLKASLSGANVVNADPESIPLQVESFIQKLDPEQSVYLMRSGNTFSNAYETIGNKAFPEILDSLRAHFDFIFVDMGSMLHQAESAMIARYLDGVIPLCGIETSQTELNAFKKLCTAYHITLTGAIFKTLN
jgi:uncharacterized protein involved in exopolysaccharide biosynthesis/Mrp family chromosome partitioning ATPase